MTGTFDNWAKTVKMTKVGEAFEKNVQLTDIDSKIYFKVFSDHCSSRVFSKLTVAISSSRTATGPPITQLLRRQIIKET